MLVNRAARLEMIGDIDALWHAAVDTLATAGFDHAIYLTVDDRFESPFLRCTVPGLYDDARPQDDPFLRHVCDTYEIMAIGSEFIASHPYLQADERELIQRGNKGGIRSALGIPMRLQGSARFGGFIVGNGMDRATFMDRIFPRAEEIRLFCLLIHRRIEDLEQKPAAQSRQQNGGDFRAPLLAPALPEPFDALSPREREIVYLLAQGRSRQEAAEICGISVHTVSDYAKSGYRKLGVNNRAQVASKIAAAPPRG
jgi:DNA-binding CsgD family transcriptional regulator